MLRDLMHWRRSWGIAHGRGGGSVTAAMIGREVWYRPRAWGWLVRVHNDEGRADVSPTGAGTDRQTRRVTDETRYLWVRTL